MGVIAKRREPCNGSHGKKATMPKRRLENKSHGAHGKKVMKARKESFQGCTVLHNDES